MEEKKENKSVNPKADAKDDDDGEETLVLTKKTILENVCYLPVKARYRYYAEIGLNETKIQIIENLLKTVKGIDGPYEGGPEA